MDILNNTMAYSLTVNECLKKGMCPNIFSSMVALPSDFYTQGACILDWKVGEVMGSVKGDKDVSVRDGGGLRNSSFVGAHYVETKS